MSVRVYETYTRYILTAWFSGQRNASPLPISLSTTIFLLYFSCSTQPARSNNLAARWREKTCLLLLLLLLEILHRRFLFQLRSILRRSARYIYSFLTKILPYILYSYLPIILRLYLINKTCLCTPFSREREIIIKRGDEIISCLYNYHRHRYSHVILYSTYILV